MSSVLPTEDDEDVILAVKSAMFRGAFHHFDSVDVRVLPILEELSLRSNEQDDAPDQDVLDAIRHPSHELRIVEESGPFAFVRDGNKAITAHFVPDFLISSDLAIRRAALGYFAAASEPDPWLSPSSLAALREYSDAVKNQESKVWVPAACRLHELLEGDFLLQLAGFRQLSHTKLDEARASAWARILKPSVSSLLSITNDGYEVIRRPDAAKRILESLIDQADSLPTLVESYCGTFGHLPLRGEFSLGEALKAYLCQKGADNSVWESIWGLEKAKEDPLTTYHICHAFITQPDLIPPNHAAEVWEAVVSLISLVVPNTKENQEGAEWDLRACLSRYYMRYLELHGPSLDPVRLLTVSWWAADRVVRCLVGHEADRGTNSHIHQWIEKTIAPVIHRMELIDFFAGPAGLPSMGRLFTLHLRYPWSVCLLGEMLGKMPEEISND